MILQTVAAPTVYPLPRRPLSSKSLQLVNSLLASGDSLAFRRPVDWRSMGLSDYPSVIKRPMDLGTVKLRLEEGGYATPHDIASDVRLIWENCRTYNCGGVPRDLHKASRRGCCRCKGGGGGGDVSGCWCCSGGVRVRTFCETVSGCAWSVVQRLSICAPFCFVLHRCGWNSYGTAQASGLVGGTHLDGSYRVPTLGVPPINRKV